MEVSAMLKASNFFYKSYYYCFTTIKYSKPS